MLNEAGIKTAFIEVVNDTTFIAQKCEMVPIEWVTRRLATGSFLKRHQGIIIITVITKLFIDVYYLCYFVLIFIA